MIANPYTQIDWNGIAPIITIAVTALVVLFADLLARTHAKRWVAILLGGLGTLLAAGLSAQQYGSTGTVFSGAFALGGFTVVFEEIVLLALFGSLLLFATTMQERRVGGSVALMLWSACGALLMAGASNLMTVFLGIELLSLALYCLCGMNDRPSSRESALKYLVLSSTASGFMLLGMALLFGASGSVALSSLTLGGLATSSFLWSGSALFFVGLAFKLSLAPFHAWSPDVYEGAPMPVTAFMSVATKAATLAVLARFLYAALPTGMSNAFLLPIWILAGLSMLVGNLGMLAQTDLKRLLAYSGVAQAGYLLVALAGTTALGLRYAIYYLVAYALMNLGAFAVAAALSDEKEAGSSLSTYHALASRRPYLAAMMSLFLLALAGLPPTAGFLGKILLLSTGVATGYWWLAALLIVGTAISLFAYAKIIRAMYARADEKPRAQLPPTSILATASIALYAIALVVMTFYPLTPSNILPFVH